MKSDSLVPILCAAAGAALVSTVAELLLWWMAGENAIRNLFRDAYLAAAIVMGRRLLDKPIGFDPLVMGVATLVHCSLSLAYAAVLAKVIRDMPLRFALPAGGARLDSSFTASTCTHSPRSFPGSFRFAA